MTGADAIIKCLKAENVDTVFGYPGVAICPFYDSILDSGIDAILVRTEQNAGHAASGYARTSGKVGVCAVTSGPGALNLLTGVATAFADSIPLVCITGQVETDLIGSDVFQEADTTGAAESFVKYSYLIKNPDDIPRVFKEAFYIASTGRRGPVIIDVPTDVQRASVKDFDYPEEVSMRTYKPTVKGHIQQIKKAVKELENSSRPLICAGGGIFLSDACAELREFVEKHRIPVVSTMMGIGVLPTSHPMYYGMVGNNGCMAANRAMKECDVLIMVGARVADRAVAQPGVIMENKVLVHIDVDPAEIGKNVGPTIPIVGDAKHIFHDFDTIEFFAVHEEWIATLEGYRKAGNPKTVTEKYVDPAEFVNRLSNAMDDDAIYVADVGQNQIWSCRNINVRNGRFLTSGGMGTMGYSIPAAMGAKRANPDRQVVAVCGDGSFQMSMMELATIGQSALPVKIVVMKNHYLGMVREFQHYSLRDRYSMVALDDMPDLSMIAGAYGIDYILADSMDGIDGKISAFLKGSGSAIMEIAVDPMDTVK